MQSFNNSLKNRTALNFKPIVLLSLVPLFCLFSADSVYANSKIRTGTYSTNSGSGTYEHIGQGNASHNGSMRSFSTEHTGTNSGNTTSTEYKTGTRNSFSVQSTTKHTGLYNGTGTHTITRSGNSIKIDSTYTGSTTGKYAPAKQGTINATTTVSGQTYSSGQKGKLSSSHKGNIYNGTGSLQPNGSTKTTSTTGTIKTENGDKTGTHSHTSGTLSTGGTSDRKITLSPSSH